MIQGADPKVSDSQSARLNDPPAQPAVPAPGCLLLTNELPDRSAGPVAAGQRLAAATHADRKQLFLNAGKRIVELPNVTTNRMMKAHCRVTSPVSGV